MQYINLTNQKESQNLQWVSLVTKIPADEKCLKNKIKIQSFTGLDSRDKWALY